MEFIADHFYQLTYKDAAAISFKVMDNNAAFHLKRVSVKEDRKEIFLYQLLTKEWEGLKEITAPGWTVSSTATIEKYRHQQTISAVLLP